MILGIYLDFIQTQLQGCLAGIPVASISLFLFEVELHFTSYALFSYFLLMTMSACCILRLHLLKKRRRKKRIPTPSHASGSSSSFMETYPHFPTWQYEVMNPDGSYSSVPLDRPEYTLNVPWPNPVCS